MVALSDSFLTRSFVDAIRARFGEPSSAIVVSWYGFMRIGESGVQELD